MQALHLQAPPTIGAVVELLNSHIQILLDRIGKKAQSSSIPDQANIKNLQA